MVGIYLAWKWNCKAAWKVKIKLVKLLCSWKLTENKQKMKKYYFLTSPLETFACVQWFPRTWHICIDKEWKRKNFFLPSIERENYTTCRWGNSHCKEHKQLCRTHILEKEMGNEYTEEFQITNVIRNNILQRYFIFLRLQLTKQTLELLSSGVDEEERTNAFPKFEPIFCVCARWKAWDGVLFGI